jgi:beta-lactamase class A
MLLGVGIAIGHQLNKPLSLAASDGSNSSYPLLSSRLFSNRPYNPVINFTGLRKQLGEYYQKNSLSGSLYFNFLSTGTAVQVDGDDKEIAASLMKLPAAMDAYKAVEQGNAKLDQEITLQPSMLDSGYGTLYQKGAGYKLTLREAIKIMLEQSDNTALKAVTTTTFGMVKPEASSLNAVDADLTQNPDLTVSIGARSYSSFLTCLYFSCYNSYANSQAILSDLTETPFSDRLVAGIKDKGIVVAHKIGVNDTDQGDCGIVYLPNKRYVLCILLDGADNATTDGHIANLSRLTYDYVKNK